MNYHEVSNRFYETNEGFVFQDKRDGTLCKMIIKAFIHNYEVIPEPEPEEPEEVETNGEFSVSV